jgi:hypothetical protein
LLIRTLLLTSTEPVLRPPTDTPEGANGSPVAIIPAEDRAIVVEPDISPVIVTKRPIFVYLPDDEKLPTTVAPPP